MCHARVQISRKCGARLPQNFDQKPRPIRKGLWKRQISFGLARIPSHLVSMFSPSFSVALCHFPFPPCLLPFPGPLLSSGLSNCSLPLFRTRTSSSFIRATTVAIHVGWRSLQWALSARRVGKLLSRILHSGNGGTGRWVRRQAAFQF